MGWCGWVFCLDTGSEDGRAVGMKYVRVVLPLGNIFLFTLTFCFVITVSTNFRFENIWI
jgi:hypothetical protein